MGIKKRKEKEKKRENKTNRKQSTDSQTSTKQTDIPSFKVPIQVNNIIDHQSIFSVFPL